MPKISPIKKLLVLSDSTADELAAFLRLKTATIHAWSRSAPKSGRNPKLAQLRRMVLFFSERITQLTTAEIAEMLLEGACNGTANEPAHEPANANASGDKPE